jgi:tryptophan halogenase
MKINKIIIVGGGSSGWMTAATLIKVFPKKQITVIESPNIQTIGVGESTNGGIRNWTNWLGIDDKEFLKHTDGTYKLSIRFENFSKIGESFHYPFGNPHLHGNMAGLNDWWFKKAFFPNTPVTDYADCMFPQMALVNQNKITYNEKNIIPFNFYKDTAFHFDAIKFALWLRDHYCIPKGVKHIKEEITSVEQNEDGIKSLNNKHKADLYVDCTGFKAYLLDKTLKEPFESYENLLPNNSAWAIQLPYKNKKKELVTYTNCTALNNGWVWKVPLWSRTGTGYVYSDKFVSDEDALIEFKKYLKMKEGDFRKLKMRVGIHKRLWVKNVVAIGLSAGFMEPLESNGLLSVHEFLIRLVRNVQRDNITQWDKDNFNYDCKVFFRNFAEFVALHYAMSQREDTKYWKTLTNKNWDPKVYSLEPVGVNGTVQAIRRRSHEYEHDINAGYSTIAAGMDWASTDMNTLLYFNSLNFKEMQSRMYAQIKFLTDRKDQWNKQVKKELSLHDFLKKNIYT